MEAGDLGVARLGGEDDDVVAGGAGGPEADHALGGKPLLVDDSLQHGLRVGEQIPGGLADDLVVKDQRIAADQLPTGEEWGPVDVVGEVLKIPGLEGPHADEAGLAGAGLIGVELEAVLARLIQAGAGLDLLAPGVLFPNADVFVAGGGFVPGPFGGRQQA